MQKSSMNSKPKVGFLLSAGGSAFARSVYLSGWPADRFHVVTDRDCGALAKAGELGITSEIVIATNRSELSAAAAKAFSRTKCSLVISHFSRLVGPELFENLLTVNVHPSLLPAYPGLDGVGEAARAEAPMQGATLHAVDAGMDTGAGLAQTAHATPTNAPLAWRHALAYRQKVVMTLVVLDWLDHDLVDTSHMGLAAFDLGALPVGDTFCTPGFVSAEMAQSAATLFDDLGSPS
jgi:phosphoribosylglycinamide formyltransferase-1